jgi:hypothetical protein
MLSIWTHAASKHGICVLVSLDLKQNFPCLYIRTPNPWVVGGNDSYVWLLIPVEKGYARNFGPFGIGTFPIFAVDIMYMT